MTKIELDNEPPKSLDRRSSLLRTETDSLHHTAHSSIHDSIQYLNSIEHALRVISHTILTDKQYNNDSELLQLWSQLNTKLNHTPYNTYSNTQRHNQSPRNDGIVTLDTTSFNNALSLNTNTANDINSNNNTDNIQHIKSVAKSRSDSTIDYDNQHPHGNTTDHNDSDSDTIDTQQPINSSMFDTPQNTLTYNTNNDTQMTPHKPQLTELQRANSYQSTNTVTDNRHYDVVLQTWRGARPVLLDQASLRKLKSIPHTNDALTGLSPYKRYWYIFRREFCRVTSIGHQIWAALIILTVIYFSFTAPVLMAFYTRLDYESSNIKWVGFALDLLFIFDIIKSLFTGYNSDDDLAFDFKRNVIRYASDGYLFTDLLSITYTPFLFYGVTPFSAAWQLVRLVRWYKISLYLKHLVRSNIASSSFENTRVLRYLSFLLILIHFFACIWLYIGYVELSEGVECTWFSPINTVTGCIGTGVYDKDYVTTYINAFYYSASCIASDGYATAVPITPVEQAYTAVFQMFGQLYFAFLLAQLVTSLANNDAVYAKFRSKLRSVNALLEYKDVPSELRERVVDYYQYSFHQRKTYPFFQQDVFNDLSHSLKRTITSYVNKPLLEQVYLLQGCDPHFMRRLMTCITQLILVPGDYLVIQGDINTSMLFITKGVCEVKVDGEVVGNIGEGDHFGELVLVKDNAVRNSTIVAITHCDVSMLQRKDIKALYLDFPDQQRYLRQRAHETINIEIK